MNPRRSRMHARIDNARDTASTWTLIALVGAVIVAGLVLVSVL